MKKIFTLIACVALVACSGGGNNSKSESGHNVREYHETQPSRMVICPMCNGTGVFEYMPGDIFAPREQCACCNGTGLCTEEMAEQNREAKRKAEEFLREWNGNTSVDINTISYPTSSGRGRSAYEIQRDIEKAYRLLDDMERQYRECTSHTIAAQYPSMMAKQREFIQRLEDELRHASY